MDTSTVPAKPQDEQREKSTPDYVLRGLGIFELHREDILRAYQGGGRWLIPSGSETGKLYEVRVGSCPERNKCECVGFHHHNHCAHLVCAKVAARKSAVCDDCGERRYWTELIELRKTTRALHGSLETVSAGGALKATL